MSRYIQAAILSAGLLLSSMRVMASPAVDNMSDMEVSEYAIRMSAVLEKINNEQLCLANDLGCVCNEFARNGVAYDDKVAVQKRLVIMIGSIY